MNPSKQTRNFLVLCLSVFILLQYGLLVGDVQGTTNYTPKVGDYFEFKGTQGFEGYGTGWYVDWEETTTSQGRYEVIAVDSEQVTVRAYYDWRYSDSENGWDRGHVDRTISFWLEDRYYVTNTIDLDDYDDYIGTELAIWFWVSPNVKAGDQADILDDTYEVKGEVTYWSALGNPQRAIKVHGQGSYQRVYDRVKWQSTWHENYYFDPNTGYVLHQRYREDNEGYHYGEWTTWTWMEDFDITKTNFPITIDTGARVARTFEVIAWIGVSLAIIYGIYYLLRWRSRTVKTTLGTIKIRRVYNMNKFPPEENKATDLFGPFLWDFSLKTLLGKGRVAVALKDKKDELVGVANYGKKEKIGTIFCRSAETTEVLRQFIRAKDFFSEERHKLPKKYGGPGDAYNVFETYQVLKLEPVEQGDYDTRLIRYMKEEDIDEVTEIATKVYHVPCNDFIKAQLASGDVGFVAEMQGKVVGFGFCTLVEDGLGRIHTLTVRPEFRNMGIGKEIMRARLTALHNLGAISVITEIADWNLSSLRVSSSAGFVKVGEMFVETIRSKRIKKNIVRR